MIFISELKKHPRYRVFKKRLEKKEYLKAFLTLFNGLANITFPFRDSQGRIGVFSYDEFAKQCVNDFGSRGPNSIRCWRIYLWRQITHAFGGFLLSMIPSLILFLTLDFYLWMYLVPLVVGIIYVIKEYTDYAEEKAMIEKEYGANAQEAKNFFDVVFWMIGASIMPAIFSLFKNLHF